MSTQIARPATERQIAFVKSLVERIYGADNAPEHFLILCEIGALDSPKAASATIDGLLARAKAEAPKAAAAPAPRKGVETGFYRVGDDIYRVVPARSGGHNYAKVLRRNADGSARWDYAAGAMRLLAGVARMTREEAADYGRSHGFCVACGALLTDPESIARGMGPVCAKRF